MMASKIFVDESQSEDEGEAGEQDCPRKRARVVTDESAEQWIDFNQRNPVPESDDEMQRFRDHLKLCSKAYATGQDLTLTSKTG